MAAKHNASFAWQVDIRIDSYARINVTNLSLLIRQRRVGDLFSYQNDGKDCTVNLRQGRETWWVLQVMHEYVTGRSTHFGRTGGVRCASRPDLSALQPVIVVGCEPCRSAGVRGAARSSGAPGRGRGRRAPAAAFAPYQSAGGAPLSKHRAATLGSHACPGSRSATLESGGIQ